MAAFYSSKCSKNDTSAQLLMFIILYSDGAIFVEYFRILIDFDYNHSFKVKV